MTFYYQGIFPRFLEVFVPVIILFKGYMNNLFIIVFSCSRAFHWYQTWYVNNYLNLINCQAGQKKCVVLVSLPRATSRDVTWCHVTTRKGWTNHRALRESETQKQPQTDTHPYTLKHAIHSMACLKMRILKISFKSHSYLWTEWMNVLVFHIWVETHIQKGLSISYRVKIILFD